MENLKLPSSIQRLISRYVRSFAPEQIVLFGSYAKNTNHPNSDVDLLVIADLIGDNSLHLRRAYQLAADCYPPVDIVFATTEEVKQAAISKNPFLLSILGSGTALYKRNNI